MGEENEDDHEDGDDPKASSSKKCAKVTAKGYKRHPSSVHRDII